MKNNKGISAIIGVILMVAMTVVIAATVYYYVETTRQRMDAIEEVSIDVTDYFIWNSSTMGSFTGSLSNSSPPLIVTFKITNPGEKIRAHIRASSFELIVENRTVVDEIPSGLAIRPIMIGLGNNTHTYQFDYIMWGEEYYKVELQLVTEFAVYNLEPLYIL